MLNLKHLLAVIALGTALVAAPAVVEARTIASPTAKTHTVKHKSGKKAKKHSHRKHGKKKASAKSSKHTTVSAKKRHSTM